MEHITLWILVYVSFGSYDTTRMINNPVEAFKSESACIFRKEGVENAFNGLKAPGSGMGMSDGTAWVRFECHDVKYLTEVE